MNDVEKVRSIQWVKRRSLGEKTQPKCALELHLFILGVHFFVKVHLKVILSAIEK